MVLHVIKSNIYSGAENVVCQIIQGIPDEDCIYMSPHGPIEERLNSLGLYKCYRGIDKLTISSIKAAVDELHPTVVHAHDFTASVLCAFALKGNVPVISHLHCNPLWLRSKNFKTISYLLASRYFSRIIAVSDSVTKEYCFSSKLKCPVSVLGNPFSMESVLSKATDDAPSSDILYVGRLENEKNPLGLIEILHALDKEGLLTNNFICRLVGDGQLKDSLVSKIDEYNLENKVFLEGFSTNPYSYMSKTKILLMPSNFEGFGLVALEAMSFGKPVVCSGVGGLDTIINDTCGFKCHSTAEYTTAIKLLLTDTNTYKNKSAGAITRSKEFDNFKDYCTNIKKLYNSLK